MMKFLKEHFMHGLFGLAMGYALSRIGFSNYAEIHKMFIFSDFRLLLTFAGAVVISMLGFFVLARGKHIARKAYSKGTIFGSVLFGTGWAITGACPSVAFVQLGEGRLAAAFTLLGILLGVWVYRRVAMGALKLDTGVCGEV